MQPFRKLKNQFGIGLLEIMVAIGLTGGLALTISKVMQNFQQEAKQVESKRESINLKGLIQDTLNNTTACQYTFSGVTAAQWTSLAGSSTYSVTLPSVKDKLNEIKYSTTSTDINPLTIKSLSLTNYNSGLLTGDFIIQSTFRRSSTITQVVKPIKIPINFTFTGTTLSACSTMAFGGEWMLGGNAGTVAGTDYIGTSDSKDFVFKTNATERARFTVSGNLGIGTTTPTEKLHVFGGRAIIDGLTTGTQTVFKVMNSNSGTTRLGFQATTDSVIGYQSKLRIGVVAADNAALTVDTMMLDNSGKVGIGTTAPSNLLSLGGQTARIIAMERNTTAATGGQGLTISSGGAIAGTANLAGGDLTLRSGIATGTGSSAMRFFTATAGATATTDRTATEKMTILGSGNVGVGTIAPTLKGHFVTASTNDGVMIEQTGTTAAALRLKQTGGSGHDWALLSLGTGNSQLEGTMELYDYSGIGTVMGLNGTVGSVGIRGAAPSTALSGSNDEVMRVHGSVKLQGYYVNSVGLLFGNDTNQKGQIRFWQMNAGNPYWTIGEFIGAGTYPAHAGLVVTPDNAYGFGAWPGVTTTKAYIIDGKGYSNGGAGWGTSSDGRLKRNIEEFSGALSKINLLRPVRYEWINKSLHDNRENEYGFIAQDVEKYFPDWVTHIKLKDGIKGKKNADSLLIPEGEKTKHLSLTMSFNAFVVKAIQELDEKFNKNHDSTENQINDLQAENKELRDRLAKIEKMLDNK